jgi:hypothetical protein
MMRGLGVSLISRAKFSPANLFCCSFTRGFTRLISFVTIEAMFARRLTVNRIDAAGARHACPIGQIDNFAMRNFTNDAVFDDTFPVANGILEAGNRVPLEQLQRAMEDWFRRKGYLKPDERLEVSENGQEQNRGN